jgi:large subunit ribosomal protein L6
MSRIGRKPIPIPSGVKVTISDDNTVTVEGPKGKLTQKFHPDMIIRQEGDFIKVDRPSNNRIHRALHGLTRALLANMVTGVKDGFEKRLRVVGIGYRAQLQGDQLVMQLGYSHPVNFKIPEGVKVTVGNPEPLDGVPSIPIIVSGIDKQLVGETAAAIRRLKKPRVYKPCVGIRYEGERVRMKEGKTRV